ncbi:hypothetical protein L596_013035 [Steinernema carpocapsae]|uniref:Uncharacterized protein n=1 Tax=Steinernema carpocapsae TaxID=34508 RepID=A0A4U5NYW2_STECR|nr:hypothetical protein L596_013035 [Steinernema carpocapsae]
MCLSTKKSTSLKYKLFLMHKSFLPIKDNMFRLLTFAAASAHNTKSFSKKLLWTVEGQLQFKLGSEVARTTAVDGIEYHWPLHPNVVEIGTGYVKRPRDGAVDGNIREPYLTAICQFVHCEPTEDYCTNPIKPRGHCCYVCGRRVEFELTGMTIYMVNYFIEKTYENENSEGIGITFIKITEDVIMPFYQVAIISSHPKYFDADLFEYFENKLFGIMYHIRDHSSGQGISVTHMKNEYSSQNNKITFKNVVFTLFVVATLISLTFIGTYGLRQYETNPSFRLWLHSYRSRTRELATVFTRGYGDNADDRVELVQSSSNPNFVEDTTEFVNEVYNPTQMDPFESDEAHPKVGDVEKLIDIDI